MGQDVEQDRENLDQDRDEMPRWVRRLLLQMLVVVLLIAGFFMVTRTVNNADAKAEANIECLRRNNYIDSRC